MSFWKLYLGNVSGLYFIDLTEEKTVELNWKVEMWHDILLANLSIAI